MTIKDQPCPDIRTYHQRSKHSLTAYAAGPDSIDWDQQPDPFRRYDGAPQVRLPLAADGHDAPYAGLWQQASQVHDLDLAGLALLLEQSLALSAWKQYGTARWSLRCNPSSGNLHPTESWLLVSAVPGLADGLYHYRADLHALELRCTVAPGVVGRGCWIGFSSVLWREAWKYGERAFRYCQHDVGHALAAVALAARSLGWQVHAEPASDAVLESLLTLDDWPEGVEPEMPEILLRLQLPEETTDSMALDAWQVAIANGQRQGQPSVVDRRHLYQWPVLEQAAQLSRRVSVSPASSRRQADVWPSPLASACTQTAAGIFRQRRSAQAFDSQGSMSAEDFFILLDHCLPRSDLAPWQALEATPTVHLILFVHRVDGLAPGLYALPRTLAGQQRLRTQLRPELVWNRVDSAPAHLPLYRLLEAKAARTAARLSCQQAIAGDSCFSLAMLAELDGIDLEPWRYRQCFHEAGAIGQQLYLDAEAAGLRGTGIGCFYDDAVHELLGISDPDLQSIYHFTVGVALHDPRIASLPPYNR